MNGCLAALRHLQALDLNCQVQLAGAAQPQAAATTTTASSSSEVWSSLCHPCIYTRLVCGQGLLSPTWARLPLATVQHIATLQKPWLLPAHVKAGDPVAVICHACSSNPADRFGAGDLREAARKLAACPGARALTKVIIAVCDPREDEGGRPGEGDGRPEEGDGRPGADGDDEDDEGGSEETYALFEGWRAAVLPLCHELCPHGVRVVLNTRVLGADGEYAVDPDTGRIRRDWAGRSYVDWWSSRA